MNSSIIEIDNNLIPSQRACVICDKIMHRNSTRNHCKSKAHNIKLLLNQFDSFNVYTAEAFIEKHILFCVMNEDKKTIFVRKQI